MKFIISIIISSIGFIMIMHGTEARNGFCSAVGTALCITGYGLMKMS